jgi:anti-sigma regulatory factor (Ser/Thr protein kinase)
MLEELSLHLLDMAMNSLAAGTRTLQISVLESRRHDWLILRVRDDGHGMDAAKLERVLGANASSKQSRRKPIGLGLALLRQTSEMCGGTFHIISAPGRGTSVTASMRWSHVDRPPLGDLQTTILSLCAANPEVDVRLHYRSDSQQLNFSSKELVQKDPSHHEPGRTQETQRESAAAGCPA